MGRVTEVFRVDMELLPTRDEAEGLLRWAAARNPGPWEDHSRVVARAAEAIARAAGLDADHAYICGLLHDIGRYEGVRGLHHIIAGYELLKQRGYGRVARVCLSHSFPYQDLRGYSGGNWDCDETEMSTIAAFVHDAEFDDYDRLIQLCDALGTAEGICLMQVRLVDVVRRHGFSDLTLKKWEATFQIKARFDELCGCSIYELFGDEVSRISLLF